MGVKNLTNLVTFALGGAQDPIILKQAQSLIDRENFAHLSILSTTFWFITNAHTHTDIQIHK